METLLENIIGVIEGAWSKLAPLLNLEEMGGLDSLQSILADPLLLGLTLAVLTIIPYTIYKVKNAYAEKEKRLDALLRELDDEENNEEAGTKPLFENQNTKDSSPEEPANESDSKAYGDEFESPSSEKTTATAEDLRTPQEIFKNRRISDDDFGWETSDEEWGELYDYISKPFQSDKSKQEGESTTVSQKSEEAVTAPEDLRTPQEIFKNRRISDNDFGWETSVEEWDELYDYISKPFQIDKQTAASSSGEALPKSKEDFSTVVPAPKEEITASVDQATEATTEVSADIDALADQIIEKTISKDPTTEESSNIGIDELAELIEGEEAVLDIDQTNEILAPGKEVTVGIDPTTESTSEKSSNMGIDELAELIEEEELGASQTKSSTANIPSTLETKPLEFEEATDGLSKPETMSPTAIPQRVELTLEDVESSHEPKPALQTIATGSSRPASEAPSAGPLLNSMLNSSVSAKTDALVSRLKTFQSELETRFQSLEQVPETATEAAPTETLRKRQGNYQPAKVSYKSKRKSRSNKEYLRQLESFIFMARQKSKGTDA